MSLYGTLNYGKPKSTAARLSCDEGIEQSVTNLGRYPRPLVGDKHTVRPARKFRVAIRKLMRLKLASFEKNIPVRRRCLHGVQQKVEECAVHQVFVAFDCHWRCRELLDGSDPIKLVSLGIALAQRQLYTPAIEPFRKAARLDPDNFEPHYNLGLTYFNLKDYSAARGPG